LVRRTTSFFVDRNAGAIERQAAEGRTVAVPLRGGVAPPFVIAENRMDAERRLQSGQRLRPFVGANQAGAVVAQPGHKVAEQNDHVGVQTVRLFDY
jgi:hypothetical protein